MRKKTTSLVSHNPDYGMQVKVYTEDEDVGSVTHNKLKSAGGAKI